MEISRPSRISLYCVVAALIACPMIAYWNIDKCSFVDFDDPDYVYKNYHLTSGFTKTSIKWAFTSFDAANWHPLTWLSHMLDYQLYGLRPAGHHLTSLVFHILNTLLLFFLLRAMTGAFWKSAFVAALFALHPLHVESVAWVSERKDVLSTFLMLITLLWYTSFALRKKMSFYFAALLFFFLALLAKPMIVTLPFIMLLLDFWPFRRVSLLKQQQSSSGNEEHNNQLIPILLEKIPFLILSLMSCIVTVIAQHAGGAIVKATELPFLFRFENSIVSYLSYIEKTFWPDNLCFFYPIIAHAVPGWKFLTALALLLLISIFAVIRIKKQPSFLVGWLWFLGTLVPVIGIVQVGSQAMADRYSYVPLIGLFIIIAWLLDDLCGRKRPVKPLVVSGSLIVLVLLTIQTRAQAGFWKNDLSLADHCLAVTGDNVCAYTTKGGYLLKVNDLNAALDCYRKSLSLVPADMVSKLNIGCIYLKQGKITESVGIFREVLANDSNNLLAMLNYGKALALLGDTKSALLYFSRALARNPEFAPAIYNLGTVYAEMKDYEKSRHYFLQALRVTPNDFDAYCALGNACFLGNRREEAIQWYKKSISINPWFVSAYRQLGMALDSCGDHDCARRQIALADSIEALFIAHKGMPRTLHPGAQ